MMRSNDMENRIRFSVLMSVYHKDTAENVEKSINSLLSQTLLPDQIVIVIDGEIPQELSSLIDRFAKAHEIIDVCPLAKCGGLGAALCKGISQCRYDWVARMDSDDISLPDRFEKQIEYLAENRDIDVLGGQIAEYDENMEHFLCTREVPSDHSDIVKKIKYRNPMNHVTVMYKKDMVIRSGSYRECPFFEDYYLWCRMIKQGCRFGNLDSVLVNVRTGEDMYRRRGGKAYNAAIIEFQKKAREAGVINGFEYYRNLMIRLLVSSMPNSVRGHFYLKRLRSKTGE